MTAPRALSSGPCWLWSPGVQQGCWELSDMVPGATPEYQELKWHGWFPWVFFFFFSYFIIRSIY